MKSGAEVDMKKREIAGREEGSKVSNGMQGLMELRAVGSRV